MTMEIIPLTHLPMGRRGLVVRTNGQNHDLNKRLSDLGLYEGISIETLNSVHNGPMLVKVGDATVGIERDVANEVMVIKERN